MATVEERVKYVTARVLRIEAKDVSADNLFTVNR